MAQRDVHGRSMATCAKCKQFIAWVRRSNVHRFHRLTMELDIQSLFGLLCTAVLIGWNPATPPPPLPPHLGSYARALLVSQDRRHLPDRFSLAAGVQWATQASANVHLPNWAGDLWPGGGQVDGLQQQGILHPRHHPGRGQGAGQHTHTFTFLYISLSKGWE